MVTICWCGGQYLYSTHSFTIHLHFFLSRENEDREPIGWKSAFLDSTKAKLLLVLQEILMGKGKGKNMRGICLQSIEVPRCLGGVGVGTGTGTEGGSV